MINYGANYFNEGIFSTDYAFLASVIKRKYNPAKVIEFGCGPGHLTIELSKLGIFVDAIDGYSNPDFSTYPLIKFHTVDLNTSREIAAFLKGNTYDIAICTEVAEHLQESSSEALISFLTKSAPVVIFSAAVPEQKGHGHINCQSRSFWHALFTKNDFQARDSLRSELQANENLSVWYRLNVIDYIDNSWNAPDKDVIIQNLINSESYASTLYYQEKNRSTRNDALLNYGVIKIYLKIRNAVKKMVGKNG